MPDVSPTRWHLAHTTWFFETFVLQAGSPDYEPFDAAYQYLFNSYYNTVGRQFPRSRRGLLSRPSLDQIWAYRHQVDRQIELFLAAEPAASTLRVIELGLNHEQQHQELMLTDIKHVFSCNPLLPAYRPPSQGTESRRGGSAGGSPPEWPEFAEGIHVLGATGDAFCFDNETPRHRQLVHPFRIAQRLVTNEEYVQFVEDGGYRRPELWLSLGWACVQEQNWQAPLYWQRSDGAWLEFTLQGLRPLVATQPVCHVSYFEADAFARWSGKCLPSEFQWELAARDATAPGVFVESECWHPQSAVGAGTGPRQMLGDLWEWTCSQYLPYPGYRPDAGALGEYNGKFMCNQFVLRGGSCATPQSHIRPTYRNFFPPEARWQFSGIRLCELTG
jgi:ergothioneine biosynthesis protein EgtB